MSRLDKLQAAENEAKQEWRDAVKRSREAKGVKQVTDTDKARFSRKVVRINPSPMNPKVKVHQLDCGHDVYLNRRSRKQFIFCEKCAD